MPLTIPVLADWQAELGAGARLAPDALQRLARAGWSRADTRRAVVLARHAGAVGADVAVTGKGRRMRSLGETTAAVADLVARITGDPVSWDAAFGWAAALAGAPVGGSRVLTPLWTGRSPDPKSRAPRQPLPVYDWAHRVGLVAPLTFAAGMSADDAAAWVSTRLASGPASGSGRRVSAVASSWTGPRLRTPSTPPIAGVPALRDVEHLLTMARLRGWRLPPLPLVLGLRPARPTQLFA